jgi:hypothetical protein
MTKETGKQTYEQAKKVAEDKAVERNNALREKNGRKKLDDNETKTVRSGAGEQFDKDKAKAEQRNKENHDKQAERDKIELNRLKNNKSQVNQSTRRLSSDLTRIDKLTAEIEDDTKKGRANLRRVTPDQAEKLSESHKDSDGAPKIPGLNKKVKEEAKKVVSTLKVAFNEKGTPTKGTHPSSKTPQGSN